MHWDGPFNSPFLHECIDVESSRVECVCTYYVYIPPHLQPFRNFTKWTAWSIEQPAKPVHSRHATFKFGAISASDPFLDPFLQIGENFHFCELLLLLLRRESCCELRILFFNPRDPFQNGSKKRRKSYI